MRQEIKERIEKIRKGEVPEGYFIDSGILGPKSWRISCLSDCGKWVGGGTPFKGNNSYWKNGHIPWATSQDITQGNLKSTKYKITEIALKESTTNIIPPQSIVVVMRSGILRHTFPVMKTATEIAINQDLKALIVNEKSYYEYVYYLLRNEEQKVLNDCVKTGTTVESVDFASLKRFKLLLPPLEEQLKITTILSAWDIAIELKEQLIEQKKEQKRGLMKKILAGEVRLPGFEGEWKEVELGSLGNCIRGVSYKPNEDLFNEYTSDSVVLLRANNILNNKINYTNLQFVNKNKVNDTQMICENDIAIAMSSGSIKSVGKIGYCGIDEVGKCVGAFCAIYRCWNKSYSDYVKHFFETDFYNKQLLLKLEGSNINNLKNSDIESLKMFLPLDIEEVKHIGALLKKFDKHLCLLEQELEALKIQKKGLMQLLLTGIVRTIEN